MGLFAEDSHPVSERLARRGFYIPSGLALTESQMDQVAEALLQGDAMSVFDGYARYYDLLYRDKDYAAEARHVHDIIQRHSPGAHSILELGCGTGAHAIHLATMGYAIHGVDRSHEMLAAE